MADNKKEECSCHHHTAANPSATQTLTEMDFERGIWNAVINDEIDRVKDFVRKGQVNATDNSGYTALHYASRSGNEEICKYLIDNGANINAQTNGGVTSLHRAAMMGHYKIVEMLLNAGAIVDIQDDDGQTALHRSAAIKNLEISILICKYSKNEKHLKSLKDKKDRTSYDLISNINGSSELEKLKIFLKT